MPPPPSAPSAPAAVEDQAPPSMLLPGNFPFPAVDERERENGAQGGEIPIAMAAGPSAPPPTYPALPRGLKPFVDVVPNSDEDYELQYMHLLRMFWRRSAYYFGERDDEYEARARAGDVSRFGDDARESDDESGEDDAQEGDEDDDDKDDERPRATARCERTAHGARVRPSQSRHGAVSTRAAAHSFIHSAPPPPWHS